MPRYAYDLHIHTCLSPCGDELMTPPNIANMAALKGLDLIAVTDHGSARNVRAVMEAARELPLTVIPGMELTTSEEIHVVCLFPDADSAEAAGSYAESRLAPVTNRPEIFGRQVVMDAEETVLGEVGPLLIGATSISVDDAPAFAASFGGFCYPAHIDRPGGGILAAFGMLPEPLPFGAVEVHNPEAFFAGGRWAGLYDLCQVVTSSDAHYLQDIAEAQRFLELPAPDFPSLQGLLGLAP